MELFPKKNLLPLAQWTVRVEVMASKKSFCCLFFIFSFFHLMPDYNNDCLIYSFPILIPRRVTYLIKRLRNEVIDGCFYTFVGGTLLNRVMIPKKCI